MELKKVRIVMVFQEGISFKDIALLKDPEACYTLIPL